MISETFWYLVFFRIGSFFKNEFRIPVIKQILYILFWVIHKILSIIIGIQIPLGTKINQGLYLPHYGLIVVHQKAKIGMHCNIGQGVTIGIAGRKEKKGVPEIGNYVYIAPGAKIIGKIKIGNNVMIGANAVVTKDVPDNSVVAGIPARIISNKGWDVNGNPYQNVKED
ncbi:serine acetyltransferase [Fictibacillus nanhaiensis]|nr:serine acetyltransferase [Fictibacillus nanhaiensis]